MLVSIIVPAYKQGKTIRRDIRRIHKTMLATRWNFEVIVVDDGSPDDTLKQAKRIKLENVRVYGYENNKGKGYAIRYGMARARGDYILFIDSGMDINPNGISMLLEHMEWYNADIIVGSKRHPVSKQNYPFIRRVYTWGYHTLVRVLFGIKLRDTQTGLKLYKRKVLEKVLPRLLVKQFAIDIETLAVARHLGFSKIYEAPVKIEWDEKNSNFSYFLFMDKHVRKMMIDTLAVFYRLKVLRYYDTSRRRGWVYDKDLDMRVNTGEFTRA